MLCQWLGNFPSGFVFGYASLSTGTLFLSLKYRGEVEEEEEEEDRIRE